VLSHAARVAALGLVVGAAAALVFSRTLSAVLFGVTPWDPATLIAAAALLAAATLLASYIPARRAGRVDPATTVAAE
jgi:ABC-type antimicrobial peptide transport system permease subunit